jgi:hypothetical protein
MVAADQEKIQILGSEDWKEWPQTAGVDLSGGMRFTH